MIVREGPNVKYTHDEEAMIAALLPLREFAGVSRHQILTWIRPERDWGWNKDYWHVPGSDFFRDKLTYWYGQSQCPEAVTVTLWNVWELARHLIERRGFSCIACGTPTDFEKRGKLYFGGEIEEQIRARQTIWAPTLICRECAIDLPMVMRPYLPMTKRMSIADRLIERMRPFSRA